MVVGGGRAEHGSAECRRGGAFGVEVFGGTGDGFGPSIPETTKKYTHGQVCQWTGAFGEAR